MWWSQLYLALFLILAIAGLWDDYRSNRQIWFLIAAGASNVIIVYLFVSYWHPSMAHSVGYFAPIAYVGAVLWELYQARLDLNATGEDPEDRVAVIVGVALTTVISLPAFILESAVGYQFFTAEAQKSQRNAEPCMWEDRKFGKTMELLGSPNG
jgi:peptidoglycan/LPS O-acetylase OafA/YrhL